MESILQNGYISVFDPPFLDSDCDRGGGVLVLRTGYAADWPPEILGRVGRKIQKANFAETQNIPPLETEFRKYVLNQLNYLHQECRLWKLHWFEKSQRTYEVLEDKLRCKVSALNKLVCVSPGTKIFKQKYSLFSQTISVSGNITPADKTQIC